MHEVTCSCRGSGGKPANQPDARAIEDARKGVMEMSEEETKVEAATEAAATEDSTTDVETTDEAVKAEGAEAGEAAPKKKGKKWPIVGTWQLMHVASAPP